MTSRALAVIAALALPVVASAQPPSEPNRPADTAGTHHDHSGNQPGTSNPSKPGAPSKGAQLSDDDVRIVSHQHHVNQVEIDMGKHAKRVGSAPIKRYGNMLITDHTAADKQLTAFAKKHGLAKIPAETPQNELAQQEMRDAMDAMNRINKLKGPAFDREFITMMITDHDKEVGRIEVDIVGAREPELAALLRTIKPMLQRHADAARELQKGQPTASANPPSAATPPSTR